MRAWGGVAAAAAAAEAEEEERREILWEERAGAGGREGRKGVREREGATCAAEVEVELGCMGMGEEKAKQVRGPRKSVCGVVFPVRPRRRWQRTGTCRGGGAAADRQPTAGSAYP